jgi:glycosyltransferase involved in cell wall biosynthesis
MDGKLWALKQGIDAAMNVQEPPDYLLLTDADIVHSPESLSRLVAHAESNRLVLTSLMVKLRCESFAEHANIPAFIFFLQMAYRCHWSPTADKALILRFSFVFSLLALLYLQLPSF